MRQTLLFAAMGLALILVGLFQSWNVALSILNLSLISAVMALGVNIQWGYAGLFNVGMMGFAALGGVAAVLVSVSPVPEAWAAGGSGVLLSAVLLAATVGAIWFARRNLARGWRGLATGLLVIAGYAAIRTVYDPAVDAIEAVDPARSGYLGGLGLPIVLGWAVGGVLAGAAAWVIGKVTLGLRADYLAIATLGISEIVLAVLKNEDWLARGVKNVSGLPRPVPREIALQEADWFIDFAARFGATAQEASGVFVKSCYAALFALVLAVIFWLSNRALNAPWGRMMRAIRDNRDAAEAMGKDVTRRHLQVFVLGSAVVGIAGAMLVTYDGQFTPGSYNPLRFTFLVWVMVIVGGSGNNAGAVLGGFLIWFLWIEAEPAGAILMRSLTFWMEDGSPLRSHLLGAAPHLRLFLMGLILLLVLRFAPRGLIPERQGSQRS